MLFKLSWPELRLALIYGFYFTFLGCFVPYWPLFLSSKGFSGIEIGYLMALLLATKIISPAIWGWLADHYVNRVRVVRFGVALALAAFTLVFLAHDFWSMAIVIFCFSFFFNAVLPQIEAVTLAVLGEESRRYGRVRLWGSVGFIWGSLLTGFVLTWVSIDNLPWFGLAALSCILLQSLFLRSPEEVHLQARQLYSDARQSSLKAEQAASNSERFNSPKVDYLSLFKQLRIWQFILVCFFMQVAFGPYYSFMSIYLEQLGFSKHQIAWLWSWGVFAEVMMFLCMSWFAGRLSVGQMFAIALVSAMIRWIATPFAVYSFWSLILVQSLHATTFAMFHAACISHVHQIFARPQWGQGMALYSTVSYGMGGAVGAVVSGFMWSPERPNLIFWFAAISAMLGLLSYKLLRPASLEDA